MASPAPTERAQGKIHYYLPFAISAVVYGAGWSYSDIEYYPTIMLWGFPVIWFLTISFLFVYLRWNGPKHLRKRSDEIRVIPHYRGLIAQAFFTKLQLNRLVIYYLCTLIGIGMTNGILFMLFVVWGSASYFGLIATHIMSRLDLMARRSVITQTILWGGMPLYLPMCLWLLLQMMAFFWSDYGSDALMLFVLIIMIVVVILALYLPIRASIRLYHRAMDRLRELNHAEYVIFANHDTGTI